MDKASPHVTLIARHSGTSLRRMPDGHATLWQGDWILRIALSLYMPDGHATLWQDDWILRIALSVYEVGDVDPNSLGEPGG